MLRVLSTSGLERPCGRWATSIFYILYLSLFCSASARLREEKEETRQLKRKIERISGSIVVLLTRETAKETQWCLFLEMYLKSYDGYFSQWRRIEICTRRVAIEKSNRRMIVALRARRFVVRITWKRAPLTSNCSNFFASLLTITPINFFSQKEAE